jgi:plastocyanin
MQQRNVWTVLSVVVMAAAVACGGGDAGGDGDAGGGDAHEATAAPAAPVFDAASAGNLSGMVMLDGELPAAEELRMNSDPVCATSTDSMTNNYVGSNGHLGNVFVYVKEGLEGQNFPADTGIISLNQEGCRYTPHVMGIRVGQTLEILNSDPTLHNIHASPSINDEFNMGQPIQGMRFERTFDTAEVMVPFKCDVHGWMNSYIGVMDHPYFAVTSEDGLFDISSLPPGDYVLEAWHEALGTQTQSVTVATGQTTEISFTFTAP